MDNSSVKSLALPGSESRARFKILRDGRWLHDGGEIRRPEMVRLFATILRREEDGRHWLVTPVERAVVEVEDAPFLAVQVIAGETLRFITNIGEKIDLRQPGQFNLRDGRPYLAMRSGLSALLTRGLFIELANMSEERDGKLGLVSSGHFYPLGPAS